MSSQQPSEQVKEKINIVDFLKGYLELKPAGRNLKARCPFHQERTPSFIISPDRQIWHCFGCGAGGDIFKFLMEYENIEFYEALKILAERAGIELRGLSSSDYRQFGVLHEISAVAKDFYREQLTKHPNVKSYLLKRGLNEKTIDEFEIGYAPNDFDATAIHLMKKGYKIDDILRAGVVFKTERGKYGDRFRGRAMFPIHNHFGKVVGFSGRIMPEFDPSSRAELATGQGTSEFNVAKYINSPETPIFNKSRVMYGYWRTKQHIREKKTAVLVEGQMDFLMAWQSGIDNVVASSGTALTPEHMKTLKPIADRVIIAYDNDEAGKLAVERAIDLLGSSDFTAMVLSLGEYKDPADAAVANKDFLAQAQASAKKGIEYYFDRYLGGSFDRKIAIRTVLQKIANLYSQIDRSDWLRELSHRTDISENDLREEMDKLKLQAETGKSQVERGLTSLNDQQNATPAKLGRLELVAMRVLGLALANESFRPMVVPLLEFMPEGFQLAHKHLFEGSEATNDTRRLVDFISLSAGASYGLDEEDKQLEIKGLLGEIEIEYWKLRAENLRNQIRSAEIKGDEATLAIKLKEFDSVSRRMQDIKRSRK